MFCNRCGAPLQPGSQLCPTCGRQIGDPVGELAHRRLRGHLETLGGLWMALGVLFLVPAACLFAFGGSIHLVFRDREPLQQFFPLIIYFAAGTLTMLGGGGICLGLGLMRRRPWARTVGIALGILALFHVPMGTALGIYTLWVLLADENGDEYRYMAQTG
jgi:hypothetical protein